jgi:hypothetical protein
MLNNLSAILDEAEAHAKNRKIDPEVLLNYRLAADMRPFIRQVQIAADQTKGAAARLAGVLRAIRTTQWRLAHFVMPNFYFHCTTAYDILRHCGVELGKRDFIGTI